MSSTPGEEHADGTHADRTNAREQKDEVFDIGFFYLPRALGSF
jgi:hypothetical protein